MSTREKRRGVTAFLISNLGTNAALILQTINDFQTRVHELRMLHPYDEVLISFNIEIERPNHPVAVYKYSDNYGPLFPRNKLEDNETADKKHGADGDSAGNIGEGNADGAGDSLNDDANGPAFGGGNVDG